MAAPSVTWTFANSTTSDATQVNTNFTDLINGASDGTKDYTIGTLSVAGAASFNGTVTLGNASADDITFTGSLASSIPVKANATYNFGAATTGLLSVYLGNGTKTTRLMAGTVGTSWTLTLPNDVPSVTGMGAIFDTSGTMSFRYADKFTASKTGTYNATGDETIIPCDASSADVTVNLPAASTMTGKSLTILKTDTSMANKVIIDGNASETILPSVQSSNLTYNLYTQYESVTLKCDGTSWYVIIHSIPTVSTDGGALTITGSSANPTKGTTNWDKFWWRRVGDECHFRYEYRQTAAGGGAAGTGDYQIALPTGITIDTTTPKVIANSTVFGAVNASGGQTIIGSGAGQLGGANNPQVGYVLDSTRFKIWQIGNGVWSAGLGPLSGAIIQVQINGKFPVPNWNP